MEICFWYYNFDVQFFVHRVEPKEGMLVEEDDLGDNMIFVGKGCSRSWSWPLPGMSDQFFTKNCVYFVCKKVGRYGFDVWKYCLSEKKLFKSSFSLFHPREAGGIPCNFNPFWVTPNLG